MAAPDQLLKGQFQCECLSIRSRPLSGEEIAGVTDALGFVSLSALTLFRRRLRQTDACKPRISL